MNRPTRQQSLMETAFVWARRSTCSRLHVGCVIHREGRILVQGYNGAPAGLEHCDHSCTCAELEKGASNHIPWRENKEHYLACASQKPCLRAVHAEQNAISFAARWGVGLEGAELFCTNQPCLACAQTIINAGIVRVIYAEPYRLRDGHELLEEAGIEVGQFVDFAQPS